MKYRLVPENELLMLLEDSHRLACLDWDGVDNWYAYMEGRREYIAMCLKETKQYKDKTSIELDDIIIDEDIDFNTLAEVDIEKYAEYVCPDKQEAHEPIVEMDKNGNPKWGGF